MTVRIKGPITTRASRHSTTYWPTTPARRRAEDPPVGVAVTPCALCSSSPTSDRSAVAIVDPPIEDDELQEGDDQRHQEETHRQHAADPVVLGLVEDLEHQRLGRAGRAAVGDD